MEGMYVMIMFAMLCIVVHEISYLDDSSLALVLIVIAISIGMIAYGEYDKLQNKK